MAELSYQSSQLLARFGIASSFDWTAQVAKYMLVRQLKPMSPVSFGQEHSRLDHRQLNDELIFCHLCTDWYYYDNGLGRVY